jgi:hypothetical protein
MSQRDSIESASTLPAPGLGRTAVEINDRRPRSYVEAEQDPDAAPAVRSRRVLHMRRTFRRYRDRLTAVAMVVHKSDER